MNRTHPKISMFHHYCPTWSVISHCKQCIVGSTTIVDLCKLFHQPSTFVGFFTSQCSGSCKHGTICQAAAVLLLHMCSLYSLVQSACEQVENVYEDQYLLLSRPKVEIYVRGKVLDLNGVYQSKKYNIVFSLKKFTCLIIFMGVGEGKFCFHDNDLSISLLFCIIL